MGWGNIELLKLIKQCLNVSIGYANSDSAQGNDGSLSWPGLLTHSAQFSHKVVMCQPWISCAGKDRRPNH